MGRKPQQGFDWYHHVVFGICALFIPHKATMRRTRFDTDGTTWSSQAWLGGATLCTPMHLHSNRKCLPKNVGIPGLFWSHWSLLSTSDYIGGDDIIVENSCRSKAASWDNDWMFIVVDLNVGNWLTEFHALRTLSFLSFRGKILHNLQA